MAVLILTPSRDMKFMAIATSLGLSADETKDYTKRPLSPTEAIRVRRALEDGFYELINAEVRGQA